MSYMHKPSTTSIRSPYSTMALGVASPRATIRRTATVEVAVHTEVVTATRTIVIILMMIRKIVGEATVVKRIYKLVVVIPIALIVAMIAPPPAAAVIAAVVVVVVNQIVTLFPVVVVVALIVVVVGVGTPVEAAIVFTALVTPAVITLMTAGAAVDLCSTMHAHITM